MKGFLVRFFRLLSNSISLPLYWVSLVVPRSPNIWVFGAWFGRSYTDNSKWLFESVCRKELNVRAIWLTREKSVVEKVRREGWEAYLINSPRGYWSCCRAGLAVACCGNQDVNRLGISRARKLQLWHGSPMKRIGLDDKFAQRDPSSFAKALQDIWRFMFPFVVERWDRCIACSDTFREYMASAFGISIDQVSITGYPRNDILLGAVAPEVEIIEGPKVSGTVKHVILYAPTHRQEGRKDIALLSSLDLESAEKMLKEKDAVLIIKMHHYHQDKNPNIDLDGMKSRIWWVRKEDVPEINPLLNYTDILITDYSGVYFDYLLLDRPIVFAPFDLEHYLAGDRELYDDYERFTAAGHYCRDWGEVLEACQQILEGNDRFKGARKSARKEYNSFIDANSCGRVIGIAKEMVGIEERFRRRT